MTTNMGLADRAVRLIVAIALIILVTTNVIHGTLAVIGAVVSGIFFITSFMGRCPLYTVCRISTRPKTPKKV